MMLPRYDAEGASSRLRTYQYMDALKDSGIDVEVYPLLGDGYVSSLYAQKVSSFAVARSYSRRLRRILSASRYDAVWVEKEMLPWVPAWFEHVLLSQRVPVVVDYDDALFHRYDQHPARSIRALYGRKIDKVMSNADLVTAGNEYLLSRATTAGAKRVEWLPTVIDLERYPLPKPRPQAEKVVVGWIGSPATAHYLREIASALHELGTRHSLHCVAIGARPDQVAGTPFEARIWSEASEVDALSEIDIGVMPLVDGEWERGKCGYKLIQYMAVGRPVVASPVGVNSSIVHVGANGYLADTTEQWIAALGRLIADPELRTKLGSTGRLQVERIYSLQAQAPRLARMLRSLQAGDRR